MSAEIASGPTGTGGTAHADVSWQLVNPQFLNPLRKVK